MSDGIDGCGLKGVTVFSRSVWQSHNQCWIPMQSEEVRINEHDWTYNGNG